MALYKGVLKARWDDASETRNVFYAESEDGDDHAALAMQGYVARFVNAILAYVTPTINFYGVDVWKYIANEVWELVAETGLNLTGGAGSDSLPHQIAGVILGLTANGKSKGKKFIPGLTEAGSIGGVVQNALLAALATTATAYITDYLETMNGATMHPVVHRKGKTDLDFTGAKVDHFFGSQRRRKQGVGI